MNQVKNQYILWLIINSSKPHFFRTFFFFFFFFTERAPEELQLQFKNTRYLKIAVGTVLAGMLLERYWYYIVILFNTI